MDRVLLWLTIFNMKCEQILKRIIRAEIIIPALFKIL